MRARTLATTVTAVVLAATVAAAPATPATAAGKPTPRPSKVAYLTFDDGPSTWTPEILRILADHRAKATFFMVGSQAARRPATVRAVRAGGHAVGNHTYDHPNLVPLPAAQVVSQMTRTDRVLGRTTCLRPPGGSVSPRVRSLTQRSGRQTVLWNVDTRDWTRPGAPAITTAAVGPHRVTTPVILMHDGGGDRSQTVAALPQIIRSLTAAGYRLETLPACRR